MNNAKLKIRSVELRNFGSVRHSKVDFPDQGFVLVTANNLTGDGHFESIGSGKTLLGEAISRVLFNVAGRFTKFGDFSTNSAGDTYVKVEVQFENQPLVVEAGYKCAELSKSGEGLRYTIGTQTPVMFGDIRDTRRELIKILGVTQNVAGWTVYVNGAVLDFSSLSESNAVALLMEALNQPPWSEYHQKAARVLAKFKLATEKADGSCVATKKAVEDAVANCRQVEFRLNAENAKLAEAIQACERRKQQRLSQIEAEQKKVSYFKNQLTALRKEIDAAVAAEAEAFKMADRELQLSNSNHAQVLRARSASVCDLGKAQKICETVKGEKQKAIREYTELAYARLNESRNQAVAEVARIQTRNQAKKTAWERTLKELELAATNSAVELRMLTVAQEVEKACYDRELNTPSVCPLAGCGKTWPKTNQVRVDALEKSCTKLAFEIGVQSTANLEKRMLLENFRQEQPVFEAVPTIPTEQVIPPFPVENNAEWDAVISKAELEIETWKLKLTEFDETVSMAETRVKTAQNEVARLKLASRVEPLSQQYETLDNQLQSVTATASTLQAQNDADKADDSQVKEISIRLAERKNLELQAAQRLTEAAEEFVQCQEAQKAASYWVEAFSPVGIPNMIIEETIPPLNLVSKRLSQRLTGGLLEVNFATSRQLKSGDQTNELVVNAVNRHGCAKVAGSSKGEGGLLNLIIAETLAEVSNMSARVGYRWYDEVSTSQDAKVRMSIFTYLKELSTSLQTLFFIVDHSAEVASFCDKVLVARKDDKGTTYAWQ
jgi:DNA repair exonuclease SbcCD ATPase subunit